MQRTPYRLRLHNTKHSQTQMSKKTTHLLIAAITATIGICILSCNTPMHEKPDTTIYNGFGEITLVDNSGYFEIMRDDHVLLRVIEYCGCKDIKPGERVYFKYNILPETDNYTIGRYTTEQPSYDIKLLVFNKILCVPIIRKSFLDKDTPQRDDSIGHDPIRVVTASFSGNYINIGFEHFCRFGNAERHIVNLVWDDTRPAGDSVYLELRHNAMGCGGIDIAKGLASFRIIDLMPEGMESIDIRLKSSMAKQENSNEYITTDKYYSGTYTPSFTTKSYIADNEFFPSENDTSDF